MMFRFCERHRIDTGAFNHTATFPEGCSALGRIPDYLGFVGSYFHICLRQYKTWRVNHRLFTFWITTSNKWVLKFCKQGMLTWRSIPCAYLQRTVIVNLRCRVHIWAQQIPRFVNLDIIFHSLYLSLLFLWWKKEYLLHFLIVLKSENAWEARSTVVGKQPSINVSCYYIDNIIIIPTVPKIYFGWVVEVSV